MQFHGLYGPGIVIIQSGLLAFSADTVFRYMVPGCEEEHLFQVLKNTIFFGNAAWSNIQPNNSDSFGMSAEEYDRTMDDRIQNPQTSFEA